MHRCVCMRMCVHTQYIRLCSFGFASEVNESMQKCSLWFGWGKTCRGGFIELGGFNQMDSGRIKRDHLINHLLKIYKHRIPFRKGGS